MVDDGRHDVGRDGEHPNAGLRLRGPDHRLAAHRDDPCLLDVDRPVEKVDMSPLESQDPHDQVMAVADQEAD
jgi:hypothetical protein